MSKKYFITTPIYYASGDLTVGHCFCTVLADACARYMRMCGRDVFFLTGSDEHGLKIARNAQKAGLTPQQFVDKTVDHFKDIWSKLHISYDKFIRTTDKEHVACVTKIIERLLAKGDIYLSEYEGLYCVPCETFFSEGQLINGNCPDCGRPVEKAKEETYFFKMSKYEEFLKNFFAENPDFLVPESRKNEIFNNFIEPGVHDLCTSRTTFDWGIPFPNNSKHVVYVWIDALVNYISALGYLTDDDSLLRKYWPCDVHLVGRDITRFHAIIWPILLHSLGLEMPKKLHSTGFITLKGDKISKSKSNGFNPVSLIDRYGVDALRYYLLKEGPIYQDIPYTSEIFVNTINNDLCNVYGNLVNRTVAMGLQYCNGYVPKPNELTDVEKDLIVKANNLHSIVDKAMNAEQTNDAIKAILDVLSSANKYIDITTPWILNKEGNVNRLDTVIYTLCEVIRICTIFMSAFLVELPNIVWEQLQYDINLRSIDSTQFSTENFGVKIEKTRALFNRLDTAKELEFLDASAPSTDNKPQEKVDKTATVNASNEKNIDNYISIDDFDKVNLVVGIVKDSEKVEGSDKLLKNTVTINGVDRIIVSGIAKHYSPADMIGKRVVVVENLKPIKLRGIMSYGMIICAEDNGTLSLVTVDKDVADGSKIC